MKLTGRQRRSRLRLLTAAGAATLFATAPIRAQGSDCATVSAASSKKMRDVPYHMYMIDSANTDAVLHGGKPTAGEAISARREMYVLSRGKWVKSPVSMAELKKMQRDNPDSTKATCSHLRDESVNGEPATVWRSHVVNEAGTIDTDMWISKSRGVVLKAKLHGRRRLNGKEPHRLALRVHQCPAASRSPMSGGPMATTLPLAPRTESHRKQWIAGLIVAFILGFLLAWFLKKCPQKSPSGGAGSGGAIAGGGAPGSKGSPVKLGKGSGTGAGGGGGGGGGNTTSGAGAGGSAERRCGPEVGRISGRKAQSRHGPAGIEVNAANTAGNLISKMAGGDTPNGDAVNDTATPQPPPGTVLTAKDFSYDSTGLPDMPSGVQAVVSAVATDTIRHKKSTLVAIVTNDSFDSVVTWYKGHDPAGWHAQSMGDIDAVAKAMSPQAIMGIITGAANGKTPDTAAVSAAQTASGENSVAILNPPNQTADSRSIMIVKKKGHPTEITMSKKLRQ